MRFSERYGYRPVKDSLQIESVDAALRNRLWNVLADQVLNSGSGSWNLKDAGNSRLYQLYVRLWHSFFKARVDSIPEGKSAAYEQLQKYFLECPWYSVFDFLEFVHDNYEKFNFKESFARSVNYVLQQEASAYRFVAGRVAPITESTEIAAIESAQQSADAPVRAHLVRALELLTTRGAPDYRNSIKESISAVESVVALTLGQKGTLGGLLKTLEQEAPLHPALKATFSQLYGYSSDQGGVRHALMSQDTVSHAEAQFMLVACSAFVSYVKQVHRPES